MLRKYIFTAFFICFCTTSAVYAQALADFEFEDPNNLTKNSVPGGQDAISINQFARWANGGVYTISDPLDPNPDDPVQQNIELKIPVDVVKNPDGGSIYIETEFMCNEANAWLFRGGITNHTGIYHSVDNGFNIRYYTTSDQNFINTGFIGFPLELGVLKKITFYYDEIAGMAYLYVDGEEIWKTTDSGYQPTPGEPFYWYTENGIVTVGDGMNGNSHKAGEGSVPSLYRFRVSKEPCTDLNPPLVTEPQISICPFETAVVEASGATDGNFYLWYDSADPQAEPLKDQAGNVLKGNSISITGENLEQGQTHAYYVRITNGACDSDSEEIIVNVNPLPDAPVVVSNPAICGEGSTTLSVTGAGASEEYRWYRDADPNSAPLAGETAASYSTGVISQTTSFFVSIKGVDCESPRTEVKVIVHPVPPQPEVEQTSFTLCGTEEVEVKIKDAAGSGYTYNWYGEENGSEVLLKSSTELTYKFLADEDTRLYVGASKGECESSSRTAVNIEVNELPFVDAGEDLTVLKGESIELQAKGENGESISCTWEQNNSLDRLDISNPTAKPTVSTSYVVKRVDPLSGCKNTDTVTVFVIDKFPVPNAFSPNQDGRNDTWEIPNIENYPECEIKVFNSWGNQVFYSKGYNTPWEGLFNGQELPSGTYYFTLKLSPEHKGETGSVVIMR